MKHCLVASLPLLLGLNVIFSLQFAPKTTTKTATTRSTTSRRQWLTSAAGIFTVAVASSAVHAETSLVSKIQGPIQDSIAPGHWVGQFLGLNSKKETWDFAANTPEEVSRAIVDVLNELSPDRKNKLYMPEFKIQTANNKKIHVLTWTRLEWLDTLDVTLVPIPSKGGAGTGDGNGVGCVAKASFFATGFLPTNIPLAPLVNIAMAWFPFASPGPRGEMLQEFRLRALRGLVTKKLEERTVTPNLFV